MSLFLLLSAPLKAESLFVFFPTTARAKVLQELIHQACPGISVTVFGRNRDFYEQVLSRTPEAILAPSIVIEAVSSYEPAVYASYKQNRYQPYFLVAIDNPIDVSELKGKKVGVVDLLGAKAMREYIRTVLSADVSIKRVTKSEDLLPLISFSAADMIFVSQKTLEFIKSKTVMNLVIKAVDIKIDIASLAVPVGLDEKTVSKIKQCTTRFDQEINNLLGVDKWQ